MSSGLFGSQRFGGLLIRRAIFVSYHHDSDQGYYDELSRVFADQYEAVRDNSVERPFDSDDADYVMRRIRENHISGTSCTIVLCGRETPWRKYVDWEIKATLDKQHGLIGINLPTSQRNAQGQSIVPDRLHDNISSGYAIWVQWADLNQGVAFIRRAIEDANSRSKDLIRNDRPMRSRNG